MTEEVTAIFLGLALIALTTLGTIIYSTPSLDRPIPDPKTHLIMGEPTEIPLQDAGILETMDSIAMERAAAFHRMQDQLHDIEADLVEINQLLLMPDQ